MSESKPIETNEQADVCKYCFEPQINITAPFIKPCACKTPVCVECLGKRINDLKKKHSGDQKTGLVCEICKQSYVFTPQTSFLVMTDKIMNDITVDINSIPPPYPGHNGDNVYVQYWERTGYEPDISYIGNISTPIHVVSSPQTENDTEEIAIRYDDANRTHKKKLAHFQRCCCIILFIVILFIFLNWIGTFKS